MHLVGLGKFVCDLLPPSGTRATGLSIQRQTVTNARGPLALWHLQSAGNLAHTSPRGPEEAAMGTTSLALRTIFSAVLLLPATVHGSWAGDTDNGGWVQLFNGKDLSGWKTHPKNPGKWRVENGVLVSGGKDVSHLFSERGDYQDFQFRIEARINDKGNSGQLFRAQFAPGYPSGYEAQINATFPTDPVRTGSLYPSFDSKLSAEQIAKITVKEQLHKPDDWFTQEVIACGSHIIVKVNGSTTVDFVDEKKTYTKGHLALQQHGAWGGNPETVLQVRKIEIKDLRSDNCR